MDKRVKKKSVHVKTEQPMRTTNQRFLDQKSGIQRSLVEEKDRIINLYNIKIDERCFSLISKSFARRYSVFPIKRTKTKLFVAMVDIQEFTVINELRLTTGLTIVPRRARKEDIDQLIVEKFPEEHYEFEDMLEGLEKEVPEKMVGQEEDDAPIVSLVNSLLSETIDRKASDIHFDPQEKYMSVRVRLDGDMRELRRLPKKVQNAVVSRLKVLSALDITENRIPQDGRAFFTSQSKSVDLRISILPTIHGEKVVIRILDRTSGIRELDKANFRPQILTDFRKLLALPHGLILVTGPTGSGKSSTLYSALNELNKPNVNIITVEDPVEFQLEGVNQVLVNASIGLTFASGLRSILRQDPNIIMLGEIRDSETAEIAIRASMTGHLVLSTLHTNDSVSSIQRLIDMGVDSFLVSNAISGVLSQRLIRTICQNCKEACIPSVEDMLILKNHHLDTDKVFRGKGCPKCHFTGMRGRMAIHELFVVTPTIRVKITEGATPDELVEVATRQNEMITLVQDGLEKALAGYTTIQEVLKVALEE